MRGYIGNSPSALPIDLSQFYAAQRGNIGGLTLSNNVADATNDIDVAAGGAMDSTSADWMALASSMTKRLDAAWAAGTGQGGLDTGTIANTTYHVHLIKNPTSGVVDVLFSTSPTAPTMPSGYSLKRRIGSILRESAAIVAFSQKGDYFYRGAITSISAANPGIAAVTRTLHVPTGVSVIALVQHHLTNASTGGSAYGLLSDLAVADITPTSIITDVTRASNQAGAVSEAASVVHVATNTSAQIRSRLAFSDASVTLSIVTLGWIDTRGRLD